MLPSPDILLAYLVYALSVIYLRSYKLEILSTILFAFAIALIRDPLGSSDAHNYFEFFATGHNQFGEATGYLKFYDILSIFGLPADVNFFIASLTPVALIAVSSLLVKSSIPILFFCSSEAFVLLSFNAMRQGLALALVVTSFSVFFTSLHSNSKWLRWSLLALSLILLGWSILTHSSLFGYVLCMVGFIALPPLSVYLYRLLSSARLQISSYGLVVIPLIIFGFLYSTQILAAIDLGGKYLSRNETYGSGVLGGFYRIIIAAILVSSDYKVIVDRVKSSFLSRVALASLYTLLFYSIFSLTSAQVFTRTSYYALIPVFLFSYVSGKKTLSPISRALLLLVGLITYNSPAVLSNLF